MERNRKAIIGIVALVAVAGIIGGAYMYFGDSAGKTGPNDVTPRWSADDPGYTSYPENVTDENPKMLGTGDMEGHVYGNYQRYRQNHDLEPLYLDGEGMRSVARVHSVAMHENDYVGTENPDGSEFTPDAYDGLRNTCREVNRVVNAKQVTVVDSNGERTSVTSEGVASEMLAEMLNNSETREQMLQPKTEYDAMSIGMYLAPTEMDDGSTVVDVYLTIDYCHVWQTDSN